MSNIGNRRTEEQLKEYKQEKLKNKFVLTEQVDFKGSDELLEQMQHYERKYREGKPEISDEEWDKLVKETGYVESLDQVVSPSGRKWVKMGSPLVSLRKVENIKDLKKVFDQTNDKFIVAPKLDGLTFVAFYELNDENELEYKEVGTRGDGLNSLILNDKALDCVNIHWLPNKIDKEATDYLYEQGCVNNGRFELRGEAVIDKYEYARKNDIDLNTLVSRNIAAGIFNRKVSYSLQSIINNTWKDSGMNLLEEKEVETNFDKIWKDTPKDIKKLLSKFNMVNRKTNINALIVVKNENNGLTTYVRERDNYIRKFEPSKDKGDARIEDLYFISFSIPSIYGNIDRPEIINTIKGAKYIGNVEDFKDLYTITDNFNEAINKVDNVYGTVNGIRDNDKERQKLTSRFAIDGVVIKPITSNSESQKIEPVKKNGKIIVPNKPKDQVAVKLETDPVRTKIKSINKKTTNLGNVTVSAEIEPVVVEGGATVKNVNLHNEQWLNLPENQWIKEGAECELRMSMDIIPIISPVKE